MSLIEREDVKKALSLYNKVVWPIKLPCYYGGECSLAIPFYVNRIVIENDVVHVEDTRLGNKDSIENLFLSEEEALKGVELINSSLKEFLEEMDDKNKKWWKK
jgi:hypothetical protein